jgi:hypothetical protein
VPSSEAVEMRRFVDAAPGEVTLGAKVERSKLRTNACRWATATTRMPTGSTAVAATAVADTTAVTSTAATANNVPFRTGCFIPFTPL